MKVDFKNFKAYTIDWTEVPETYKTIANIIYLNTKDLNLVDIAMKIYKWEEVDLAQKEIDTIKEICNDGVYEAIVFPATGLGTGLA